MSPRALLALSAAVAAAWGCHRRIDPALVRAPISPMRGWVSELHRDHPLAGRIWDVRGGRFADEAALEAALEAAPVVLLGETHDNVDHHLLQARLVRAIAAAGRRPALVFEMLKNDQQAAVDAALARHPRDPDALAKAVDWKHGGWPDFSMYRPVFAAGLEAGLPIVAANLPRKEVRDLVAKGKDALDPALRERLAKDEPLPPAVLAGLREEMRESHCGELPEAMLDPLVLAQRARDATIASRMAEAGRERGAILIAGKGHVRTDRGVPAYLAKDAPGTAVVTVGFLEVDPEMREPASYAKDWGEGPLPFDWVVFTPAAEREDPCEGLRERSKDRKVTADSARTPTGTATSTGSDRPGPGGS